MSTIEEQVTGMVDEPEIMPEVEPEQEEQQGGGFSIDFSFLKTPTGEGSIEDRLDHPLNPRRSYGVAQILRGVEGFTDTLRLAILDVGLGAAELMKERRGSGGAA